MRVIQFLVLLFLVACSTEKEETKEDNVEQRTLSYFETIFNVLDKYELEEKGETLSKTDSLANGDYFSYTIEAENDKITSIQLSISVQDDEQAQKLIENIVKKYNIQFDYAKEPSNFITWSYTTSKNLPAQVSLIYDENRGQIDLEIGYMAQR